MYFISLSIEILSYLLGNEIKPFTSPLTSVYRMLAVFVSLACACWVGPIICILGWTHYFYVGLSPFICMMG